MTSEAPRAGAIARTNDGVEVGVVIGILGDYIQLEDDADGRMWLPRDEVVFSDDEECELDFPLSDLSARVVPAPDAYEESEYLGDLSEDEREQRKIVLRQLAQQRAESYEDGEAVDTDGTVGEPVEEELDRMQSADGPGSQPR